MSDPAFIQQPVQAPIFITEERLRSILREELNDAFKNIGIDPEDTLENQKDMAWLRTWRKAVVKTSSSAGLTVITILVTGVVGIIATALGVPQKYLGL